MSILSRIIEFIFPSIKPTERQKEMMRKHLEFAEFMAENGYILRVGERGGMGWEKTEPEDFYKDRPNPWHEYRRLKGEYPYNNPEREYRP